MRRLWLRIFLAVVGLGCAGPLAAADRVALVIANSHYDKIDPLRTPPSDSKLVEGALHRAGFNRVMALNDLRKADFEQTLRQFAQLASAADVALLYYAGHGIELNGQNYLIPVDAHFQSETDADLVAIRLETIRQLMAPARLKVIVLDACRENPFARQMTRSIRTRGIAIGGGLAKIDEAAPIDGEAVLYSTRDGALASDGAGQYSPFAQAFARHLVEPDVEISLMLRKVRDDVRREVPGQDPYNYSSLSGEPFYFVRGSGAPIPAPSAQPARLSMRPAAPAMQRAMPMAPPPVAAPSYFAPEALAGLGLTVRSATDGSSFAVDRVTSDGIAAGQVLPGDVIVGINSAPPVAGQTAAQQLSAPLAAQGRLRLLIRRGATSTVVILRQ